MKAILEVLTAFVTIIGLPLAVYSIIANGRNAQRSLDLQIVSNFANRFQDRWASEWRAIVDKNVPLSQIQDHAEKSKFYDMLNWMDWLGILIEKKAFSDPSLMLKSIDSTVRKIIYLARDELNKDGKVEWPGLFIVAAWLDLVDESGKIR